MISAPRTILLIALLSCSCAPHPKGPAEIPGAMTGFAHLEMEASDGIRYTGVSAAEVLQAHFGKTWATTRAVRFICTDGFKAEIPVTDLSSAQPLLATARADGAPFRMTKHEKDVELGPAYLVWPKGVERPGGDSPYQIVRVEAVP